MNAHTPFDANQDWTNPYCHNSSNDPMVDALLGNAYHVVRTVYCNLGNLKLIYDFLNQYGMVLGVQSEAELKALTTKATFARIYDKTPAGDRQVTDYLYVEGDRTGVIPNDVTATGSWVKVATSGSSGGSESTNGGGYIPWIYNSGSAVGGETTIRIPDETSGAPFMIVNGDWQTEGYDFEYDSVAFEVSFTTPLEPGDFVVVMRTGVPATPDNPNVSDWVTINWLYNQGAAVGGEQVIDIPYTFQSVPAVYKNGLRLYKGLTTESYTIDADNNRIILTEPLTTNDRLIVQLGGEAKVLEIVDHTIQEVARAANVKDSEVILSTDTTQTLNGKKVVFSINEQKSYGLPVLPTNVYIQSVDGDKLTYSPGSVVVDLLPLPNDALDVVEELKNKLSGSTGYSYIGSVDSIEGLAGLVPVGNGNVKVASWYSGWSATLRGIPVGGGDFTYMASVDKSKHDGCVYISPTVPYSTNLSNYVNGIGETDPTGKGVWVRNVETFTHIHTDWAGINDGATASSSSAHADAVQKVFNAAAALGKHVQLGYGFIHLEKAVSMPAFFDNTSAMPRIEGYGINSSYFICTPLGTDTYSITCMLDSFTQTWGMKDFQIREKGLTKTGYLMKLGRLTGAVIERVKWAGGYQQLLAQSVLSCTWIEPCWFGGYRGAKFEAGGTVGSGYANPNANLFLRPQILTMENQGFWVVNASSFKIVGGSIEGCGAPGDTTFRGFYIQGGGSDGVAGIIVDGLYVESCSGYPFYITHSNNRSIRHSISNTLFNNNATQYPVSQVIVLGGNYAYPAGAKMVLEMRGNTAMAVGYTASTSRPDVNIVQYSNNDQAVFLDYDNLWIAGQPPVLDATVKHVTSPNFSFSTGVSAAAGTLTNRRNITSIAKGSTGVFTLTANHNLSGIAIDLSTIGAPGYAILGAEPSNNTVVVRTYNTAGAAADIDFHITGLSYSNKYSSS